MENFREKIGLTGTDKITGYTGIITGFCAYITGCDQFGITAKSSETEMGKTCWIDENRIEFSGERLELDTTEAKGAMEPPNSY